MKKNNPQPEHECKIYHYDLYGKRQEKYNFLLENNLQSIKWTELTPQAPQYFFVNKNFDNQKEYEKGFLITDLFSVNSVGIGTYDDENLVAFSLFTTSNNHLYTYRPFDTRFIDYDLKKVKRARHSVMRNMLYKNLGLIVGRQGQAVGNMYWNLIFVSDKLIDLNVYYRGGGTVFPLYLYRDNLGQTEKIANLNQKIKKQISETATPEQIFDYIYAVLHSPAYREKYKEFLKIDFPRIPYPQDAEYFNKMAALGEQLRKLHLMENVEPAQNVANFPKAGSNAVEKPTYENGKVWINDAQYFDNVPQTAWEFYIGGYQPAQKWLKDRKGRTLSYEDIEHYQKIIFVLGQTAGIMREIG